MKSRRIIISFIIISMICVSSFLLCADTDWKEDLGKDYKKVLESKKAKNHRGLVLKWHSQGHLADLIAIYQANIMLQGPDANIHYGLGYAYALQNTDLDLAIEQFQRAIVVDQDLLPVHFALGRLYQKQKKFDLALQEMNECIRINSKYHGAHFKRGQIFLEKKQLNQALQAFQTVLEIKPAGIRAALGIKAKTEWHHRAEYGIGVIRFLRGENDLARESFESVLDQKKDFAPARYKLGQVLAIDRLYDDALLEYEKASKYQPYTAVLWYELAVIFEDRQKIDSAIDLYKRAIALDPQHSLSHFQLGGLYYENGEQDLAMEHYKAAVAADSSLENYFLDQVPQYYSAQISADEARSLLDRSLIVKPDDPLAYFYYAQIEANEGNPIQAIQHYEKTVSLDPNYADVYFPLGDLYYDQGDRENAARVYQKGIELDPNLKPHFLDLGKAHFEANKFEAAIEPFDKYLMIDSENVEATFLLGQCYQETEDFDSALRFYARTIELDPNHKDALIRSARIYKLKNDPENALVMLIRLIAIDPENVEAHYLSGLCHLDLEDNDAALVSFIETTRLDPNHIDGHFQAGLLYEQKGDFDNAVSRYERTIELDQSKPEPFLRLGQIYFDRGDETNVIRVWEPGLELEPNHPQKQYHLASIFEERDQREKAIKHFGLANEYDPSHYDWHFRYARLLDRHALTVEDYHVYAGMAVEEYGKTIGLEPTYAPSFFFRGLITRRYRQIGKTLHRSSKIAEDFKQVITLQPKNADAHYYLAMTELDLDNRYKAKEFFEKTLSIQPEYNGVNVELGAIIEWEQDFRKAVKYYEKEIAIDAKCVRAYQRLGDLYRSYEMDFEKAVEMLKKALELDSNHVPSLLNYGNTLFNMDQLGRAAEQFEMALQIDPGDLTANYNLALMYEYSDKKDLAIDRWKRFLKLNPPAEWKADANKHLRGLGQ